ncbi:MAG: pyridoxamine kinase [Ruminococcaceae bacterium]|nr:pyridoxamine kinase [Oscillospiraceae bacterium]
MKRIVTVQDISCVGKCSLTVALPIISAMGVEAAILPTAVLSTHTAFKKGFTLHDLTGEIAPITAHWKSEGIDFDAIYTGYLASFDQIDLVKQMAKDFPGALLFVDPAMGDNGKLYYGFDEAFAKKMAELCAVADIIVPNMTEAAFMLGIPYVSEGYDEEYVKDVLRKLCAMGAKKAALTGVSLDAHKTGVMAYDSETDEFFSYYHDRIPVQYHGTGDVFASACVGALSRGKSLEEALVIAADYTYESIRLTEAEPGHNWYGVNFEQAIPALLKSL